MYLGIDFGTTYSTLSIYVDNTQETRLLPALTESTGLPTLMRFDGIEWYYGASTDIEHYPKDTIKDIKAKIRDGGDIKAKVPTGGYEASFEEMLRGYLAWLIKGAVQKARSSDNHIIEDEDIEGITVTVPCGFTGRGLTRSSYGQAIEEGVIKAYRELIKAGVELAQIGRPPVIITEEPVAAAMDYLHSPEGKEALTDKSELKILVADLGGGTFDVTVVKCQGYDRFQICTKEGDLHLGGNDFDEALLQLLISKIKSQDPTYTFSPDTRRLNLLRATKVKEHLSEKALSGATSDTTALYTGHDNKVATVTRQEFEDATRPLLQRAMKLIRRCVDQSGGIGTIDKIVLVGGSCRMPQIRNGIINMYPDFSGEDIVLHNPSYSIANGAAYCAAMEDVIVETIDDIATCTYGFLTHREDTHQPFVQNMILKGAHFNAVRIESDKSCGFHAADPNQTRVLFQVFESVEEEDIVTVQEEDLEEDSEGHETLNDERFNSNGLKVMVSIPSEYQDKSKHPQGAKEYLLATKMILDNKGILTLEIYHDDVFVTSNYIKIK